MGKQSNAPKGYSGGPHQEQTGQPDWAPAVLNGIGSSVFESLVPGAGIRGMNPVTNAAGKKNTPAPPDYRGSAEQQAASSRNNFDSPFGQTNWTQGPDGQWTMQSGFSGGLGDAAHGLQAQAGSLAQPMDWGQFGQINDGQAARDQAINAAYGQATSRLDPQFAQREEQLRVQLANQGLDPSSEAAKNAMQDFGFQRNDAYNSAMNSAIGQGREAGDAVFRNSMMGRQQAISEALRARGMPMDEMSQLMQLLMPQMAAGSRSESTQYLPASIAQGNQDLARWQGQNQANGDAMGGVGDLAGSLPMLLSLLGG